MSMEHSLPTDADSAKGTCDWPHAPPHRLQSAGVYFLTARAAERRHLLAADEMKDWFQDKLLELAQEFGWKLEAWAILSNHIISWATLRRRLMMLPRSVRWCKNFTA